MKLKIFILNRVEDESGVSGTGIVAYGVIFPNGWCALSWASEWSCVGVYPDIDTLLHVHGHSGKTQCLQVMEYDYDIAVGLTGNREQDIIEFGNNQSCKNGNCKYFFEQREEFAKMFRYVKHIDPKLK